MKNSCFVRLPKDAGDYCSCSEPLNFRYRNAKNEQTRVTMPTIPFSRGRKRMLPPELLSSEES